jgi:two-component system response regulator HydG
MVVVNCAAITETLLESELFGHEKGCLSPVPTGAGKADSCRLTRAPFFWMKSAKPRPTMQAKLLRVLQEKEIQRVGGEEVLPVDVRIVAATNRDWKTEVAEGTTSGKISIIASTSCP